MSEPNYTLYPRRADLVSNDSPVDAISEMLTTRTLSDSALLMGGAAYDGTRLVPTKEQIEQIARDASINMPQQHINLLLAHNGELDHSRNAQEPSIEHLCSLLGAVNATYFGSYVPPASSNECTFLGKIKNLGEQRHGPFMDEILKNSRGSLVCNVRSTYIVGENKNQLTQIEFFYTAAQTSVRTIDRALRIVITYGATGNAESLGILHYNDDTQGAMSQMSYEKMKNVRDVVSGTGFQPSAVEAILRNNDFPNGFRISLNDSPELCSIVRSNTDSPLDVGIRRAGRGHASYKYDSYDDHFVSSSGKPKRISFAQVEAAVRELLEMIPPTPNSDLR